jgi:hypothetical protein
MADKELSKLVEFGIFKAPTVKGRGSKYSLD